MTSLRRHLVGIAAALSVGHETHSNNPEAQMAAWNQAPAPRSDRAFQINAFGEI